MLDLFVARGQDIQTAEDTVEVDCVPMEYVGQLGVGELRRSSRVNEVGLGELDILCIILESPKRVPEFWSQELVSGVLRCVPGKLGRIGALPLVLMSVGVGLVSRAARSFLFFWGRTS